MDTHPDALTSGDSRCPPVLLRLTHVLHDAGHPVVRPGCAHCGKTVTNLRQLRPEGRICGTCDARSRSATCARCGQHRHPHRGSPRRRRNLSPLLPRRPAESSRNARSAGACATPWCGSRTAAPLCIGCRTPPVHQCVSCGEVKPAALVDENGAFCHLCYNRHRRPRRLCGRCGRLARIARNATGDHPDLCAQLLPRTRRNLLTLRPHTPLPTGQQRRRPSATPATPARNDPASPAADAHAISRSWRTGRSDRSARAATQQSCVPRRNAPAAERLSH